MAKKKQVDKMKDNFEVVEEWVKLQNLPKRLIVDEVFKTEFEANGKKYKVVSPELCFNIDKQVAYQNIKIAFEANQTVTDIKLRFMETKNNLIRLLDADDKTKLLLTESLLRDSFNNFDSFKGEYTSRYPAALYLCTLFVYYDNEDISKDWTWESATAKIEDWAKENLSFYDFFRLALSLSKESLETINESLGIS